MDFRQQILDAPRALRETLEKGRPEFEEVIRRVRWGEGPLFLLGTGRSFFAAQTGAQAFERLLGWRVIAPTAGDFASVGLPLLRPRSVVLALSNSGESADTLSAVRVARSRGAVVLALTNSPASALAKMADLVFLLRAGGVDAQTGSSAESFPAVLCEQAAIGYIGLVAAQTLKRHCQQFNTLEAEFTKLPGHIEWIQAQLLNAVRAVAVELKGLSSVLLVGGGSYHPVALHSALLLNEISPVRAAGFDALELADGGLPADQTSSAVLFLSGSHCRAKKKIHGLAHSAKKRGIKILSVTDSNDRELSKRSTLSVLLPELTEMVGSTLTLALIQAVALHTLASGIPS